MALNFSLSQNLEMKVLSKRDTSGVKKIKLIDELRASGSYNFLADSMNLSNISLSFRSKLTNNFGNIALLKTSAELGLIPEDAGETVSSIYRQFRKLQHQIRMQGAEQARVDPESVKTQSDAVKALWQRIFE